MKNLITQEDYEAALAKGRDELAKPHVVAARFVARGAALHVQFSNGLTLVVDARAVPAFQGLPLSSLKDPQVTAGGDGLVFDEANLAFDLPSLLAPFLPIELARSRVAAELGKETTAKKAQAARANGAKGGRPRKSSVAAA